MQNRPWFSLIGFVLLVLLVSAAGGAITSVSVGTWYVQLAKPVWTPPGWIFGPVWTALYAMMAFVAWRLWCVRHESADARFTLRLWFWQLGLNCAWSFSFFGLRSPLAGLVNILLLLGVILWMQARLGRTAGLLAFLWIPYCGWVAFAAALNLAIWAGQP